jgi:predicted membrane GTPase involved in stress response
VRLTPVVPLTLEQAIAYIEDDELVEVTPESIRLRKRETAAASAQAREGGSGTETRKNTGA